MFDISNIQSAGGKHTELLEENYSIHCDQNNSKMILGHGKNFFSWRTCIPNDVISNSRWCLSNWVDAYV